MEVSPLGWFSLKTIKQNHITMDWSQELPFKTSLECERGFTVAQ